MTGLARALALSALLAAAGCKTPPPADEPTATVTPDPELRRLSRSAWLTAVGDLLGVEVDASLLPALDAETRNFDDQADGLPVTPLLLELLDQALGRAVDAALRVPADGAPVSLEVMDPAAEDGVRWLDTGAEPAFIGTVSLPGPGSFTVSLTLQPRPSWSAADDAALVFDVSVDGALPSQVEVDGLDPGGVELSIPPVELDAGLHAVRVAEHRPEYDEAGNELTPAEPIPVGVTVVVEGVPAAVPNPARDALVTCDLAGDAACLTDIVSDLAERAWRRPLEPEDLTRVLGVADGVLSDGGSPDEALAHALRTVLLHPRFLFRSEPADPTGASRPLDAWELATRLSFLLWDTVPDDALIADAASGALLTDAGLRAATQRMLADPRARALSTGLLAQQLRLDELGRTTPDPSVYPDFDESLRAAMEEEWQDLLAGFVGTGRDLRELLTARRRTVPRDLALHYGLPRARASVEIDAAALGRPGLLGTAGLLTVLSHPERSSPTVRGAYVLGRLLCDPPQPPPANIPALGEGPAEDALDRHNTDPACVSCHSEMDPLGLALEHFDGVGAWRDEIDGAAVDAQGRMPDGTTLDGLEAVGAFVAADPRFTRCMVDAVATRALGRRLDDLDAEALESTHTAMLSGGGSLDAAIEAWVTSEPFRTHRGER